MYRQSLESIRAEVFKANEEPVQKKRSGLVPVRMENKPLEEAKLPAYGDWLKTISAMASEFRTSQPQDTAASGFVKGLSETLDLGPKETKADPALEAVPEGNKESFIKKRGDKPSYYAPQSSGDGSFISLIDKHEGGGDYDTLFKFSNREDGAFSGVKVSEKTIGELKEFANGEYGEWSKGELGYKATPMGRYQFVGTTLAAVAKEMGLPDDTVFSPEVQDSMFNYWVKKTMAGGDSIDEKISLLRGQWEGFKNVSRADLATAITKYGA